ncbi:MAG: hypothetical protein ACSHX6_03760 [Akkermansiaceae bacterium]
MNAKDITIIENIVSGELTHQERTQHLLRFESQSPECWPALAKAFVEKQILRETFAELEALETLEKPTINLPTPATSNKNKFWLTSAASAALLIIGIMLGNMTAKQPHPETPTIVANPTQPTKPTQQPSTAYVATYLENGDQLVVPINYYPNNQ